MSRAKQMQDSMLPNSTTEAPTPPQGFEYPLDGSKLLHVDGSIREKVCEVLFERNEEETSIAMLILNSLSKCPIDTRRTLAENIVILGGTAMLPGFRHRLMSELQELINTPKYSSVLGVRTFKLHSPPAKENYVAWLGGAIFGALEVLASRSLSREHFLQGVPVPDWCLQYDSEAVSDKNVGS